MEPIEYNDFELVPLKEIKTKEHQFVSPTEFNAWLEKIDTMSIDEFKKWLAGLVQGTGKQISPAMEMILKVLEKVKDTPSDPVYVTIPDTYKYDFKWQDTHTTPEIQQWTDNNTQFYNFYTNVCKNTTHVTETKNIS